MITTPYPYYQEYYNFLHRNPCNGEYYLMAFETAEHTCLVYDTNHKYMMQSQCNPFIYLYGQKAERWWQLLADLGLLPVSASPAAGSSVAQRSVTLYAKEENMIFDYLKQQLNGGRLTREWYCQSSADLLQVGESFTQELNDRIEGGIKQDFECLHYVASRVQQCATEAERYALLTADYDCQTKKITGKHLDYTFSDGVVLQQVQPMHARPFQFAGAWVDLLSDHDQAPTVQLGFTDNRQQVVAARNVEQSQRLTTQWCLEQGYREM